MSKGGNIVKELSSLRKKIESDEEKNKRDSSQKGHATSNNKNWQLESLKDLLKMHPKIVYMRKFVSQFEDTQQLTRLMNEFTEKVETIAGLEVFKYLPIVVD